MALNSYFLLIILPHINQIGVFLVISNNIKGVSHSLTHGTTNKTLTYYTYAFHFLLRF